MKDLTKFQSEEANTAIIHCKNKKMAQMAVYQA